MPTHISLTVILDSLSNDELLDYKSDLVSKKVVLEKDIKNKNIVFDNLSVYTKSQYLKYTKHNNQFGENIGEFISMAIKELQEIIDYIDNYFI
jgi:hypothetical protein